MDSHQREAFVQIFQEPIAIPGLYGNVDSTVHCQRPCFRLEYGCSVGAIWHRSPRDSIISKTPESEPSTHHAKAGACRVYKRQMDCFGPHLKTVTQDTSKTRCCNHPLNPRSSISAIGSGAE